MPIPPPSSLTLSLDNHHNRTEMETFIVEAIRQLPALVLVVLVIYFYRAAQRSNAESYAAPAVPEDLLQTLDRLAERADEFDADIKALRDASESDESQETGLEEEREAIRSQLSNQKMALKEFGRVLSKTSEQTYTEFSAFEERLRQIEERLSERGLHNDESRSAAA